MVGFRGFVVFLALAKHIVGVTYGMSCMAGCCGTVPGMDGGRGHATTMSGVTAIKSLFWNSF